MRNLLPVVLSIFVVLFAQPGWSQTSDTLSIVDIRRNIPLADDEPVYKDFYLSGSAVGKLKKDLVVTVFRKLTIRDSNGAQSYGDIEVPVGQLRVLAVFGRVAVAREYQILSRDENPMLEQTGIMSGDQIDLKGSFVDSKPRPTKRAAADIPAAEAAPTDQAATTVSTEQAPVAPAPAAAPVAETAQTGLPAIPTTAALEAGRAPATPVALPTTAAAPSPVQ